MCNKTLLVPIPEFLAADYKSVFDEPEINGEFGVDEQGRQCFSLDACIVPAVETLWAAGIRTSGCCCGHGSGHGVVSIEVPNGGDTERRDRQTRSFYERQAQSRGTPPHQFRGSNWNEKESPVKQEHGPLPAEAGRTQEAGEGEAGQEPRGYTEAEWRQMIAGNEARIKEARETS